MKQLAIVIPAYKIDFFRATLESIAAQTCKDFTVYVGDDCSPSDFESLVNEYKDKIDIHYIRFDTNMGGKDLVGQWRRCVDLTQGEPWIWLFSDDDVMGSTCVASFFNTIENDSNHDLYHFDIDAIDADGKVVFECRRFPDVMTSLDFYKKKENDDIDSFVVEYIFSRKVYEATGGFQNFDLAWGADIATWVKFSHARGIKNIPGARVNWRKSYANITPNKQNSMVQRKFSANVVYLDWINGFFGKNVVGKYNQYIFLRIFVFYSLILNYQQLKVVCQKAVDFGVIKRSYTFAMLALLPLIRTAKFFKLRIQNKKI